jgi:hypothetical protein
MKAYVADYMSVAFLSNSSTTSKQLQKLVAAVNATCIVAEH